MNKRGFTLMELMVYMAIVGIVVVIAGQVYSDSTKMRVRTQGMIKASQIAENVATLFKDDVGQMGAKSSVIKGSTDDDDMVYALNELAYINPTATTPDKSSFNLTRDASTGLQRLTFRRMVYNDDGSALRVEEISWYNTADGVLKRSCKTVAGTADASLCPGGDSNAAETEMAQGVSVFNVVPAKPGVLAADYTPVATPVVGKQYPRLLPSNTNVTETNFKLVSRVDMNNEYYFAMSTPTAGGSSVSISGFQTNYDFDEDEVDEDGRKVNQLFVAPMSTSLDGWNQQCTSVNLNAGVVYEISFKVPFAENASRAFCPGRDHMAVGFRKKSDGSKISDLDDFLFFPPLTDAAGSDRSFRFSVAKNVTAACMAFTFAFYSPTANSGAVTIQDLQLNRVESSNYEFDESFNPTDVADKQNVKAFKLILQVKSNNEAGEVSLVVQTPGNGPKD